MRLLYLSIIFVFIQFSVWAQCTTSLFNISEIGNQRIMGHVTDSNGDIYIVGFTDTGISIAGTNLSHIPGFETIFLTKLDDELNVLWTKELASVQNFFYLKIS